MSEPTVNLITSPDKLLNSNLSFLLLNPSVTVKEQFNDFVQQYNIPFVVYLYEQEDPNHEPEWLLDTFHAADYVILDIDNCKSVVRDFASYFISKNKTFWLTSSGENMYNVLSKNRLYNLDFLTETIGGQFEQQKKQ